MNHLKAIISGVVFIVISTIVMQLLFILIAVGYNSIASDFPYLKSISWVFRYILGIPVFLLIMFIGGYITASVSKIKSSLDLVVVGMIAVASMMWPLLARADITTSGIVISVAMLIAVFLGGLYSNKRNLNSSKNKNILR